MKKIFRNTDSLCNIFEYIALNDDSISEALDSMERKGEITNLISSDEGL